ncbi:unnamed protein product, partial [Tetraodon nigroviridis]
LPTHVHICPQARESEPSSHMAAILPQKLPVTTEVLLCRSLHDNRWPPVAERHERLYQPETCPCLVDPAD